MFFLKILARQLILPPASLLLLTLLGAFLIWRHRKIGWVIFIVGFGTLLLMCLPVVADRLSQMAERYPALNPSLPVNAQAVMVLGGGGQRLEAPEYNGPMAEPVLLERLTLAAYLAKRYSLPLAVSGAPKEAMTMAATLSRNFEVTPRWTEDQSRDTFENAQFSARLLFPLGIRKIILVTSGAHEWRAAHEYMAAGFEVIPAPAGVSTRREYYIDLFVPSASALQRSYSATYELIGEPMRKLLSAAGLREKFDQKLKSNTPPAPTDAAAASAPH